MKCHVKQQTCHEHLEGYSIVPQLLLYKMFVFKLLD